MSFANIVGALLQQGMAGQSRERLERTVGPQGLGANGGGIEQMLGSLLGGLGGGASGGSAGGSGAGGLGSLIGLAETFLGSKQAGNLTGGQLGGLGAIAGALLGGGGKSVKGALGGSAMAILGALAVNALQGRLGGAGGATTGAPQSLSAEQLQALADPATERLIVRAMIAAAKADGKVDEQEMERIAGKVGVDGISPEERQMVVEELRRPLDLNALVADVHNPIVAAEVYGASLLAIDIDTEAEIAYLGQLARALGLDSATVARLHELTGAPALR